MQIANITSTPGLSVGVLHHGQVIHTTSYGFRDVPNQLPPNADTSFLICSLTKAMTASLVGIMVDEGKLNFTTQLRDVLPAFQRDDAQANITVEDLLNHRTGLAPYDDYWFGWDNQAVLPRSQAIPIISNVPTISPLRTELDYNNIAYEALGQVLEEVSGRTYRDLLHERIIKPLGLNRTFYAGDPLDENTAKSYVALEDGSSYEVPTWGTGKDTFIGSAGAVRSSVGDLLVLYKAFMEAANSQVAQSIPDNPFKQAPQLLRSKIGLPSSSLCEYGYASGWYRAQLPAKLDFGATYDAPALGVGSPSQLALTHQGYLVGNVAYVMLLPESTTAVVVLGNSAGLTDTMKLIGQIVVDTVLGSEFNSTEYVELAKTTSKATVQSVAQVRKELADSKTTWQPGSLSSYTGSYYNSMGNYFLEITDTNDEVQVSYMGNKNTTFSLQAYQTDSFFWWLDFDESAKRARLPGYPKDFFVLKFGCPSSEDLEGGEVEMACLTWKHDFQVPGDGEVFRKQGDY